VGGRGSGKKDFNKIGKTTANGFALWKKKSKTLSRGNKPRKKKKEKKARGGHRGQGGR